MATTPGRFQLDYGIGDRVRMTATRSDGAEVTVLLTDVDPDGRHVCGNCRRIHDAREAN